jgi:DNA-binding XRE family transcriptional regulator
MGIRVLTFSEWTDEDPSNTPVSEVAGDTSLPRQTYTIEVPYERPMLYQEHPKTLAEHIRKKRIESGLTQKALSQLLNVAECTVYNWERGIGPRGSLKHRVEVYLNLSPMPKSTEPGS